MSSKLEMPESDDPFAGADARYVPFSSFAAWAGMAIDQSQWAAFSGPFLAEKSLATDETRQWVIDFAMREAAVDTGAIEGFYPAGRGFTITVAARAAAWESQMAERGADMPRFFEAQREALDFVVDAVTKESPITEVWIRALHATLCKYQDSYDVKTPCGTQRQGLPKGKYKDHPNHVLQRDGTIHAYCPVAMVRPEMHRLVQELQSEAFENSHPVLQASYAHFALVAIHPFADGNGRVARALASVYLCRALSIPLVIFADQGPSYLAALNRADQGDCEAFVRFVFERTIDTVTDLTLRFREARIVAPEKSLDALGRLYVNYSELSHQEMDAIATRLVEWLMEEIKLQLSKMPRVSQLLSQLEINKARVASRSEGFRPLVMHPAVVSLELRTQPPAAGCARMQFNCVVARSDAEQHAFVIEQLDSVEALPIRLDEVHPSETDALRSKLSLWLRLRMADLMQALLRDAETKLRGSGF